jgi:hypothetical protein
MSIEVGERPPARGIESVSEDEDARRAKPWRTAFADAARFLSPAVLIGLVSGAVIGGVGGRLAMLFLRLTSDDSLRGLKTDDDFTIGVFSGATFFLVLITTYLGAAGGLIYMLFRDWFPERWRPVIFGLLGATIGGALVIRPGGTDFTLVEPHLLAVVLFVLLPGAYGVVLSVFTDRLIKMEALGRSRWLWLGLLPLATVVFTGPPGIILLLATGLVIAANRSDRVTSVWHSARVTWAGRGLMLVALVTSTIFLAADVAAVL